MVKKVPPTRYPWVIERQYEKNITALVNKLGDITLKLFDDIPSSAHADSIEIKADSSLKPFRALINTIKTLSLGIFDKKAIKEPVERFVKSINNFNRQNMAQQARVYGIDPTKGEPWLADYLKTTVSENVSYITNIKDDYTTKIEGIVSQGVKNGTSMADIRDQLVKQIGMSENRAAFIAVDQSGSILGQMTAKRHQEMGVPGFTWVDSGDNRVREKHKELNGHSFSYDNPPSEGLPGTPYRCRCTADPVFDIDELEKGNETLARDDVDAYYNQVVKKEKNITLKIIDAIHAGGGEPAGLNFRIKTADSLKRKVDTDYEDLRMVDPSITKVDVAKSMNDIIRYTSVIEPDKLVEGYNQTIAYLEDKGFKIIKVKNYWLQSSNPYNGVNVILADKTGQTLELQFHTPEGLDIKENDLHKLYEERRLPKTSVKRKQELDQQMFILSKQMQKPKDIGKIK